MQVYFVTQIHVWNFMSWLPSRKTDNLCGLRVRSRIAALRVETGSGRCALMYGPEAIQVPC